MPFLRGFLLLLLALPCLLNAQEIKYIDVTAVRQRTELRDRKSTRLNSSHGYNSYAVFCFKKKNKPGTDAAGFESARVVAIKRVTNIPDSATPSHAVPHHTAPQRPDDEVQYHNPGRGMLQP